MENKDFEDFDDFDDFVTIGNIRIDHWSLSSLWPEHSGVDAILWFSASQSGLDPLILVGCDKNDRGSMDIAVSFMGTPKIITPENFQVSDTQWNQITKWIEINRNVLLKHWKNEYSSTKCLYNLKKINHLKVAHEGNTKKFPKTKKQRLRYLMWHIDEFSKAKQVKRYIRLFPELDSRLCKFGIGIFMWNKTGKINIKNPDDVSRVRIMLKIIDQTPAYDFFDNTFNEADPETVCQILGIDTIKKIEEDDIDFDYSVSAINNFEEANDYFDMASWCIVISEESFNAYTANGNRFYICQNEGWWDVPCKPGSGFPRDKYGYSLIAVEVTPENKIASITSRWNTYEGDTGKFISEEELKSILGKDNFGKLFI